MAIALSAQVRTHLGSETYDTLQAALKQIQSMDSGPEID
jgi:hypothetical protein